MKTVFFKGVLISICFFLVISCSKNDDSIENPVNSENELADFNSAMARLQTFNQPNEVTQPEEVNESSPERDTEDLTLECVVKTYKLAPGFDEMLTLDPTTDVIYPGAILKGESIPTGEYIGISLDRKPITLSASLTNITGSPVVVVDNPTLSSVREGVKKILDQEVTGATAAKINYEVVQVYSEEHLEAAIGVNYRGAGKTVSANINFNSSQYKNKFVLKFLQQYYTIDMDSPGRNPSDLFQNLPNVSDLGSTSPVYVASVAYGRMVVYTMETNSNFSEIQAAFDASVKSSDGSIDASHEKVFNSSKIKALIIGGSGQGAAQTINGPADVYKFISEGGNYSKDSPGAPLSYKLRYIRKDFPIARQVLTSEYPIRTCYEAYHKFGLELYGWKPKAHEGENSLEIYGDMRARIYQNGIKKGEAKWHRGGDPAINWDKDVFYPIPSSDEVSIEVELYKPDLENDYIEIYSNFYESNGSFAPEHFGSATEKIKLKDVQSTKAPYVTMNLQELSGSHMRTYFYIWRVKY